MTEQILSARIRDLSTPLEPKPTGVEPWLEPLQGIKAVLFDVYGTLLISASGDIGLSGHTPGSIDLQALLAHAGINTGINAPINTPINEHLSVAIRADHARVRASGKLYPEVDIREIWTTVLAEHGCQPTPQQLERIAVEYECRVNPVWPMPGLTDLLSELRQRDLVLGIVSNAQFYTPLILEAFLGQPPADLRLDPNCSAWSYQLREAKPSTAIYQAALGGLAAAHGIRPDQVLYIGNDRRNDIWPAQRLGLKTALFAGDARSLRLREDDPELVGVSADRVMTRLEQIEQIV
ncbi:HAD family hydrolase [Halochromatium roseum]|uniref:HAD family hydrolase n=1 Tax=Halochromatium roseum TaxID=391920 RepID=UPI001913CCB6|nr:HAD family hydrolase [Halochromatium roseum]MBK5939445.1 hypothetical protein [Halochromatium roseum]